MLIKFLNKQEEGYPHVSNFVLLLFSGYVIIWYLQVGYRIPVLGSIRIEFIWALMLTAIALFSPNKQKYMDNPLSGIVILLFLTVAIQVPFSYVPEHSWNIFFNRVIKFAFMAFFIVSFVRSPKGLIFFISAFMLACLKMGQEGLVGQLTGRLVWQNQGVMRLHGSTPMYTHPNSFTGMALGTIPFIIYLFPTVPKVVKVILAIQFVFACNIILHTGSRTGYVAFFVMMGFVFLQSKKKKIFIVVALVGSIIFVQYVDLQYVDRFKTIFTGNEIEGNSMEARKIIISDAIKIFADHPLGVGVGAFPMVRNDTFGRFQDTHNLYLEIATNLGFQGIIVFGILIYSALKLLKKCALSRSMNLKKLLMVDLGAVDGNKRRIIEKQINDNKLVLSVVNAIYLFIILRLALGLFGMDLYEIYWWFSVGLIMSIVNIVNSTDRQIERVLENE